MNHKMKGCQVNLRKKEERAKTKGEAEKVGRKSAVFRPNADAFRILKRFHLGRFASQQIKVTGGSLYLLDGEGDEGPIFVRYSLESSGEKILF